MTVHMGLCPDFKWAPRLWKVGLASKLVRLVDRIPNYQKEVKELLKYLVEEYNNSDNANDVGAGQMNGTTKQVDTMIAWK